MKPLCFAFVLILVSHFSFAQNFPSPTNFNIDYCYEWPLSCGPDYEPGDTVYYYTFDAPDLTGVESALLGYNLYYEDNFIVFFTDTYYEDVTYGPGNYYVTASYNDGESLPSNIIFMEGGLISVEEFRKSENITVYPNPLSADQELIISSYHQIFSVSAYDLLGKKILSTTNKKIDFSQYKKGIYLLQIETEEGILNKKIILE